MRRSRREFLTDTSIGLVGAAVLGQGRAEAQTPETQSQQPPNLPPGAPPAFGTAPAVGPEVSPDTFSEAEKLVQVEMSKAEIAQAASSWRSNLAALYERRTGPHKIELEPTLAPYSEWNPILPGQKCGPERDIFIRAKNDPGPLPVNEADIAFAPLTQLSRWVETRKITSMRLDADLSGAARALQSHAAVRDYSDARAGACASETSGCGNCGGKISRPAARHSMGSEGPARHRGDSHNLWRGAISGIAFRRRIPLLLRGCTRRARCLSPS